MTRYAITSPTLLATTIALCTGCSSGGGGSRNEAPVLTADAAVSLQEDASIQIPYQLSDDRDSLGNGLSLRIIAAPENGTATLNEQAELVYVPDPDFNGSDELSLQASDGNGEASAIVTVAITVEAVNDAPVLTALPDGQALAATRATEWRYQLSAEDPDREDPLTYSLVTGPDGMAMDPSSGEMSWTPPAGIRTAAVTVRVTDQEDATAHGDFVLAVAKSDPGIDVDNIDGAVQPTTLSGETITVRWRIADSVQVDQQSLSWGRQADAVDRASGASISGPDQDGFFTATFPAPAHTGQMYLRVDAIDAGTELTSPAYSVRVWDVLPGDMMALAHETATYLQGDQQEIRETDGWEHGADELPVREVTLSPFAIGRYEVTVRQWLEAVNWGYDRGLIAVDSEWIYLKRDTEPQPKLFQLLSPDIRQQIDIRYDSEQDAFVTMEAPESVGGDRADHAAGAITRYGALFYCWSLNERFMPDQQTIDLSDWSIDYSTNGYRLPTEAEWEYAARGGLVGKRFPWGNELPTPDRANYFGNGDKFEVLGRYASSMPPGQFPANGFGLYDIAGNMREWVSDYYDAEAYKTGPITDPHGPADGHAVIRGATCFDGINSVFRCAYRAWTTKDSGTTVNGLRTVKTISGQ